MSIRSEIETKLATLGVPIAYQNAPFTKPKTGLWVEVFLLDAIRSSRNVAAQGSRIMGKFIVNCYGQLGTGMASLESLVEQVINLFPVVPKTGTVSIEAPLSASSSIIVESFICVPVTGTYRVET